MRAQVLRRLKEVRNAELKRIQSSATKRELTESASIPFTNGELEAFVSRRLAFAL